METTMMELGRQRLAACVEKLAWFWARPAGGEGGAESTKEGAGSEGVDAFRPRDD